MKMDLKAIYKYNPRIEDYKDLRREDLVERRKSKRKDCFYQRRNYSEDSNEKQENEQPTVLQGKENRRDLLKKWKEEQKKETTTNIKKPFVVGIVRHNAGSPLFKSVPPLREKKQSARPQATRPQAQNPAIPHTSSVYCFGKQKPAAHKFKVASSVKKLTVPITPSFMDPAKRGNLTSKPKSEANGNKPPAAEKRVTRAATAAAKVTGTVKKLPLKKTVTNKENVPSTSRAGPSRITKVAFKDDHQTEKCKTAEVRIIIEKFVFSPAVRTNTKRVRSTAITAAEDKNEAEEQAPEFMDIETNNASPAQEFYDRLQRETDLLLQCCDRWSGPAAFTQIVPGDASDEIDSTVGQARLLVSDKFQQFKRLIQNFEEGSQPPVTSEDLNGFWDMINIQVDKMKERFDHLAELKNNNWAKKSAEVVFKKKVAVKPKTVKPVSKSRFQEFMAKKKLGKDSNESSESQAVTPVEETQSEIGTPIGTPLKDRVMQQILDTSRSERRRSPLATASQVLRTSLIGKNLAMSPLMKTGEKSAIETQKSIMRDNCPPSPLVTFTGKARKKVEFGVENSTESIGSPVVKRIPQTPKLCFNNLTDDETVTNTDADDDDDDDATSTVSQNMPQTPRFEVSSNRLTDDESNASSNNSSFPDSSRRTSPRLMNKSHLQQLFTPDVSDSDRSTRSVNRSTPNVTATAGKKKKVGFGTVQPIESIDTPDANIDVSNTTPVASLSFESPKLRRSVRKRQNTPYASRN